MSAYQTAKCLNQVLARFNAMCVTYGSTKITSTDIQQALDYLKGVDLSCQQVLDVPCQTQSLTSIMCKLFVVEPFVAETEQRLSITCGMVFVGADTVTLESSGSLKPFFPQKQFRITQ